MTDPIKIMTMEFVDGVLYIYNDGETVPWLAQPSWPDFTPWTDETEARAWGQTQIDYVNDPDKPRPANSPS